MKKFSLLLALVLVAATPLTDAAEARRKRAKPRVVSLEYTGTQGFQIGYAESPGSAYVGRCDPESEPGCVRIVMKNNERSLHLEVLDATGLPVNAYVWGPNGDELATVCGKTTKRIRAAGFVDVWPTGGSCWEELQPSAPTTGTIEATIYGK
jgi:hypothetical protein